MHPLKTERGRTVLQTHGNALDLRQRRALILCDGKRSLAELGGMLGDDAAALIAQLQREGYVLAEDAAATSTAPAAPVAAAPVERRRS
ncbi:MAG: hypothetical protein ACN6Q8_04715, partial [Stenotrophomonas sp.]